MTSRATPTHRNRRAQGLCVICATPSTGYYCEKHRRDRNLYQRERKRKVNGATRRNINAESYMFTTGDKK